MKLISKVMVLLFMVVRCVSFGQTERPNIIFIMTDDQSPFPINTSTTTNANSRPFGFSGDSFVHTPVIDNLAQNGIVFSNAYVSSSVCSPSRYTTLTGRYAGRSEGESFLGSFPLGTLSRTENNVELEESRPNLPRALQTSGYVTGFVGKSHVVDHYLLNKNNWSANGLMLYGQTDDPRDPIVNNAMSHNHEFWKNRIAEFGFDYVNAVYAANLLELRNDELFVHNVEWKNKAALDFIDQTTTNNPNQPFFLYYSETLPHGPYPWSTQNGKYIRGLDSDVGMTGEGYVAANYDQMPNRQAILSEVKGLSNKDNDHAWLRWFDRAVEALLNKLDEKGILNNTLIVISSDHGTYNHGKTTNYEGGVKIPLMMYWPGGIVNPGRVYNELVQNVDYAQTFLDLAGASISADMELDGISLTPVIYGSSAPVHDHLFFEIGYSRAVMTKDWKYISLRYDDTTESDIFQGQTYTGYQDDIIPMPYYVQNSSLGGLAARNHDLYFDRDQLFNRNSDPWETSNLFESNPNEADMMKEMLRRELELFPDRPFGEFRLNTVLDVTADLISLSGSWNTMITQGAEQGGTIVETTDSQASLSFSFSGSAFEIVGVMGADGGTFEVLLDGNIVGSVDTYDPEIKMQQVLFKMGELTLDDHLVELRNTNITNPSSSGTKLSIDWVSFLEAKPMVSKPSPANNHQEASVFSDLSWVGVIGAVSYNVYLSKDETITNDELIEEVEESLVNPEYLSSQSNYYWRVDAVNSEGTVTTGPVWKFRTKYEVQKPIAVKYLEPTNESNFASIQPTLSWEASAEATSYDLYFGSSNPPAFLLTTTSLKYSLSNLDFNSDYYWRVDAKNDIGTTTGEVATFKTEPSVISTPTDVVVTASSGEPSKNNIIDSKYGQEGIGEWTTSAQTTPWIQLDWSSERLVTGIGLCDLASPFQNVFSGKLTMSDGTTMNLTSLPADGSLKYQELDPKTVKWVRFQVLASQGSPIGLAEIRVYGSIPDAEPPGQVTNLIPEDLAELNDSEVELSWTSGGFTTEFKIYIGSTADLGENDLIVTQSSTSFSIPELSPGTYYWRIDAINASSVTSGEVQSFTILPAVLSTYDRGTIILYPNPAFAGVWIENNEFFQEQTVFELLDISGKLIQRDVLMNSKVNKYFLKLKLTNGQSIGSGTYFLKIINSQTMQMLKVQIDD